MKSLLRRASAVFWLRKRTVVPCWGCVLAWISATCLGCFLGCLLEGASVTWLGRVLPTLPILFSMLAGDEVMGFLSTKQLSFVTPSARYFQDAKARRWNTRQLWCCCREREECTVRALCLCVCRCCQLLFNIYIFFFTLPALRGIFELMIVVMIVFFFFSSSRH